MTSAATTYDEELIGLLTDLVSIQSFSGKEGDVQTWIANWFERQGMEAILEEADGGLKNVVVTVEGNGHGPALWIGGHCDTVGIASNWTKAPHAPVIADNRLYGLGAMDMKGGLAAAMLTVRALHSARDRWAGKVIFAALADEEAWSRGANAFVRTERGIDAAIMCEPHFHDVVIGAMGKINIRVDVTGRSAHGSRPEEGVNAVIEAARLLVAIDAMERFRHPEFGAATHCVLNVSSGDGRYEIRVPDQTAFVINWHFMPGETVEGTLEALRELADSLGSAASFLITVGEPRYESFLLDRQNSFIRQFSESYRTVLGKEPDLRFGRGVSDANIFMGRAGIPTLLFGPDGANMHSGDEWVDLDQLHLARTVYLDFARRFLTSNHESQ
ncbi:M20 family metallopeptidase [Chelatococcus asaccharovorans]|uniref:M20 family metallopeptidase n=1 Tax=Chelatococcus asaccharovorans TaxID=28210 RepID=UPI00224C6E93|nr:M20/M25/M40 family metallo-hydrolase [Chelatococcus asaccharovorans]CAH1669032.1 Acetylornithine deacetylase [Chelatococcus asaccharovorans]CAH1679547.1 Acetylornithine deacetylase [Chelatococcus asaccharovorans]